MSLGTHSDVSIDHIVYVLNDEQKTAEIVNFTRQINQATIPNIIKIKSQEYTVLINKNTFHDSLIEDITFQSDFHLEEGLFQYAKLKRVRINLCNRVLLKNYSNKLVLKKSDTNSTIFDVFLFAPAELTKIRIPPFIKTIGAFSCIGCQIAEITIPSQVKEIHNNAFESCLRLKTVTFTDDSELQRIGSHAFSKTKIESILIPSHVTIIDNKAFFSCEKLNKIEFKEDSELQRIGSYAFSETKIESILIPSHVTLIDNNAFFSCEKLNKIEFKDDSELQRIGSNAFAKTKIESILIPSHVTIIDNNAFFSCEKLNKIEFKEDSELQRIGSYIFWQTLISNFVIPSNVSELDEDWCLYAFELKNVSVAPNNMHFIENRDKIIFWKKDPTKNDFDAIIWADRNIKKSFISIPSSIKKIYPCAFRSCKNIRCVEFESNSQLQVIGYSAFSHTSIMRISIPIHVKKISNECFNDCQNLTQVDIPIDSELVEIGSYAFSNSKIGSLILPKNIKVLKKRAFCKCSELKIIELNNNIEITFYNIGCLHTKPLITKSRLAKKRYSIYNLNNFD